MRNNAVLIVFLSMLSSYSWGYFGPLCGQSYRWDSYGMGLKAAFLTVDARPALNDEGCYQAGITAGLEILLEVSSKQRCLNDFNKGFKDGLKYELNTNAANRCFTAGHTAGVARLHIATRQGEVLIAGKKCIRAYLQGKSDYFTHVTSTSFGPGENKLRNCYQQGFYEAPIVP